MTATVFLDLSRLLSRADRPVPTGIDRVELAYAEHLLQHVPARVRYIAMDACSRLRMLPQDWAVGFIHAIGNLWRDAAADQHITRRLALRLKVAAVLWGGISSGPPMGQRPTYLLVSHHHLRQKQEIMRLKLRLEARFVAFVHDLIPIEFPEYGRGRESDRHLQRIETVAALADGVIVNSAATAASLAPYLVRAARNIPVIVAPLGVESSPGISLPWARPYFIYIGTIEPRKNHLLLFHIWRRLALELGDQAPRLILIGQRGWENEMVIDIIERSHLLRQLVEEHNALPDSIVSDLMAGARALLIPSFAEGYGLPLAEALASGVPTICSDLPALREVGGDVPEYLDPLDGTGWMDAILAYARNDSPRRAAQLRRLPDWQIPRWSTHMETALRFIDAIEKPCAVERTRPVPIREPGYMTSE